MKIQLPSQAWLEVKRTTRKNSVGLKVSREYNRLLVPQNYSDRKIKGFVDEQLDWIETRIQNQTTKLTAEKPAEILSKDLTDCLVFGEILPIQYTENARQTEMVLLKEQGQTTLICHQKHAKLPGLVKTLLVEWLFEQIHQYLAFHLPVFAQQIQVTDKFAGFRVKDYKARWGSCYPDGRLQFNWRLVMMPKPVIDYVIIHELCHLIHMNHSKAFWAEVVKYCPDYSQHKQWLKKEGHFLMDF